MAVDRCRVGELALRQNGCSSPGVELKVFIFHPAQYPCVGYGGTERVVEWLARGLLKLGCEVYLSVKSGSVLDPGIFPVRIESDAESPKEVLAKLPERPDVIHFMAPFFDSRWEESGAAVVQTIHGNGKQGEIFHPNSIFISRDHARRHGRSTFVYNGLDPDDYLFSDRPRAQSAYLFFSKTNLRTKNVRGAVSYCMRTGQKLDVAGGWRPFSLFLRSQFTPLVNWIGPVSGVRKLDLLKDSRALLFPILWEEPFGLVLIESLVSGTPVVASRRGSVPEIIGPEVGITVSSDQQWHDLLKAGCPDFPAKVLRDYVASKFHYLVMARNTLKCYERVLAGKDLTSSL